MKQLTTLKRIWSLFLTLAMVAVMGVTTLPVYAADGVTISVKYEPNGVTISEPTEFELYKVGNFGRFDDGTVSIDLTKAFENCPVSLNGITPPEEGASQARIDQWNNEWLQKASELEQWVKVARPATDWKGTLASGPNYQTITENGATRYFDNGIYLLIGYEQREGEYFWAPVPVLMMVLNKNVRFDIVSTDAVIKTVRRPVAYKHVLHKKWDDKGHEGARPTSVDVEIYYGDADGTSKIDTVTLSENNNWTYIWYSQEAADARIYTSKNPKTGVGVETEVLNDKNGYTIELPPGDKVWGVLEKQTADLDYYTVSLGPVIVQEGNNTSSQQTDGSGQEPEGEEDEYDTGAPADVTEFFKLTNKFETRRVRIIKHLLNYLDHNDEGETYANTTVAFDVKGYVGPSTTPSYHNQVGMTFTAPGDQEIVLNNIPVKVTRVVVEEIYNPNYVVVGANPIEKDITKQGDVVIEIDTLDDGTTIECPTFIFEFTNKHDGPPKYGSGIINKYEKDDKGEYKYIKYSDTSGIYPYQKPQSPR